MVRLGGVPETWVIEAGGVARRHWVGTTTFEQLQAGYREATGEPIDARDGGPFDREGAARAVLGVSGSNGALGDVYVGGDGGLARYDVREGGAAASDFESVNGETVLILARHNAEDVSSEPLIVTERGLPGLPAAPISKATDDSGRQ